MGKGSKYRPGWSFPAAFLAAFFLAACTGGTPPPVAATDGPLPQAIFAAGYGGIAEKYIEPRTARDIALDGLHGLSDADPALEIEASGDLLRLDRDDRPLRVGVAPTAQNLEGWASLSADFLVAALTNPAAGGERDSLMTAMFTRALETLDSYSRYAAPKAAVRQREKRKGFDGAGLYVQRFEDAFFITAVIPESPAALAGVRPSDEILEIDGAPVAGLDLEAVLDRLHGPVNSTLSLALRRRDTPAPIGITLQRQHVYSPTVEYERLGAIAYFRLSSFNHDTAQSLARHIAKAEMEAGKNLRGLVLDLRDNPGGLMDQAIAVADLFLESGRIVSTRGRHPNSNQIYDAAAGDIVDGLPIVVLLNGKSASSAEIVAAALHDRRRAVVVGSRSYGKGSVQTILPLPNQAEITLTWSHLYRPNGQSLNEAGVAPDVCTANAKGKEEDMEGLLRAMAQPGGQGETACPPLRTENPLDLPLAKRLLGNAELYASFFRETPEEIARAGGKMGEGTR
ncbi:MAG: S41 family peptidase [Pseudomonadota bacterium]